MANDPCHGDPCRKGFSRCMKHGALYAREQMEKQGWTPISEWGGHATPGTELFRKMCRAVEAAKVDMQHWQTGWDEVLRRPTYGIWAPRSIAAVLGTLSRTLEAQDLADALASLDWDNGLVQALEASKRDQEFRDTVDAAYKLGGPEAAQPVITDKIPELARWAAKGQRK